MARFTEHAGDPQWLRDQRDAARRATTHPTRRPVVFPGTPAVHQSHVSEPDPQQFVQGAKSNTGVAFVLGAVAGAVIARGRRR